MKKGVIAIMSLCTLICLTKCKDKTIRDLEVAKGKIAGQEWEFARGSAFYGINEIKITLMNDEVPSTGVCAINGRPSSPYMQFTIPAAVNTYYIPFDQVDKSIKFYEGSSSTKNLTASSGYVQIVSISAFGVDGLIVASLDDDNDIIGAFYVEMCN